MIEQVRERTATGLKSPRAIELCAGFGGIGLGLQALGFDIVRAYDSWDAAVAVYNHNFSGDRAVCHNLLTAAGFAAVKEASQEREDIELLAAGPPCKGFSQLRNGNHDGRNGNNRVLAAMPRYVALIRPRLFLIENVPDLMRHRRGRTLRSLLEQLRHPARGLRYVVEHRIYDAAAFGTPQARRRLLIAAVGNAIAPADALLGATTVGDPSLVGAVLRRAIPWAIVTGLLISLATIGLSMLGGVGG